MILYFGLIFVVEYNLILKFISYKFTEKIFYPSFKKNIIKFSISIPKNIKLIKRLYFKF